MSSTYYVLCLSHDPAITARECRTAEQAADAIKSGDAGHPGCDLVIERVSGGPVEIGCPPAGTRDVGPRCYHRDAEWVDVEWLRLLDRGLQLDGPRRAGCREERAVLLLDARPSAPTAALTRPSLAGSRCAPRRTPHRRRQGGRVTDAVADRPAAATKTCADCKAVKPLGDFTKSSRRKDGRHSYCRLRTRAQHKRRLQALANPCCDCGTPTSRPDMSRCIACSNKTRARDKHHNYKGGRHTTPGGYIYLPGYQDHPNANAVGQIAEHVLVMSRKLGRPLLKGENVHHLNGQRDDNRPENLELWSRVQPPGQRVEDKVAWAIEILQAYRPELLKEQE